MKIIVLAGGLSPERDVSLTSGAGICKTLLENGHQAYLLDLYFGLENAPANLEDVFYPSGQQVLRLQKISAQKNLTLKPLRNLARIQSDCMFGPNVIELCRMADLHLSLCTALSEKMVSFRLLLIFLESNIQAATLLAVPCL